ncbi:MAG: MFS transporter [Promethearchaeota archaeon]
MASLLTDLKAIPRNSKILLGVSSSWYFSIGLISSWKSLYISLFGGYLLVGFLATVTIGFGILLSFTGGHLGAAYSEKKIILASVSITAIGYGVFALANTLELLLLGVVLMTFMNLGSPCLNSIYFGEVQRQHRGLSSGLRTVCWNVAAFTAPIVSTHLLLTILGFAGMMQIGLFLTAFCLAASSAIIALLVHPDKLESDDKPSSPSDKRLMLDGLYTTLSKSPVLRLLLMVTILEAIAYSISSTFIIFIITEIVGVTIDQYSVILLIYGIFFIPLGFLFGRYADRKGRWRCALGFVILPFVDFGLVFSRGFWQMMFVMLVGAVGVAAWMQAKYTLITDLTPRQKLASVFSVFITLPSVFALFTPLLSGFLLLILPLAWLWLIEVTILGVAATSLLVAYNLQT